MTPTEPETSGKSIKVLAQVVFMLSVALVLLLGVVMVATRAGALSVPVGFEWLTLKVAPIVSLGLVALSVVAGLIALIKEHLKHALWALAACLINGGLLVGYYAYVKAVKAYPPVAEVSTNWDTPVTFSDKMMAARGKAARSVDAAPQVSDTAPPPWRGRSVAEVNAETCPGAVAISPVNVTEDDVAEILKANAFQVFSRLPWRVEGTYQDDLYGFQYDVVVRIDPTRIDVRAVSRQHFADMGRTCGMVTRLVEAIKAAG